MKNNNLLSSMIVGAYLGASLGWFAHLNVLQWQFYAICVPVIVGYNLIIT
jgi:hypothetical protein